MGLGCHLRSQAAGCNIQVNNRVSTIYNYILETLTSIDKHMSFAAVDSFLKSHKNHQSEETKQTMFKLQTDLACQDPIYVIGLIIMPSTLSLIIMSHFSHVNES